MSKNNYSVRELMTPSVRTVTRRQTARAAADLMKARHIQHLIVVDVAGRVCGVISDRDIRAASPSSMFRNDDYDPLTNIRVEDLMSPNPVTVRADDDVATALRAMQTRKIGCLAVVDALGGAVGIVTGYDVVTLALRLLDLAHA